MRLFTSITRELMRLNDNLELIMGHFGINAVALEKMKKGDTDDEVTYSSDLESLVEEIRDKAHELEEEEETKDSAT